MKNPYRQHQKTSFIHYEGWGFYANYIAESPQNEQVKSAKNANKIIATQVKQINRQSFQNKRIRSR